MKTIYFERRRALTLVLVASVCACASPDPVRQGEKYGWSLPFKAMVDLAAVHSQCRLCIFLADATR